MTWPDNHSMSSDEGAWEEGMVLPSPSPTEATWKRASSTTTASFQAGQLSPVSSGIDCNAENSSGPAVAHSASSSCTDSWSNGYADRDDPEEDNQWDQWDQSSDDALPLPKLEPVDDDINLHDLEAAPLTPLLQNEASASQLKLKRPRGRPRKHPLTPAINTSKITKGRSKTGCITCRKRKKKCDEAKPRCMPRESNTVTNA